MNKAFEKILERLEELRQNQIKELCEHKDFTSEMQSMRGHNILQDAKKIVQEVAEEYKGGWIACSERLPDVEEDVLLSLRSLDVHTGFRSNTEGYFYVDGEGYVEFENVLAWQPLPEPFKEINSKF